MRKIDGERVHKGREEREKSRINEKSRGRNYFLISNHHRTKQQSLGPTLMRKSEKEKKEDCQPMRASLDGN
jgi:hypothetical protein